jgi:hypothetical protein
VGIEPTMAIYIDHSLVLQTRQGPAPLPLKLTSLYRLTIISSGISIVSIKISSKYTFFTFDRCSSIART